MNSWYFWKLGCLFCWFLNKKKKSEILVFLHLWYDPFKEKLHKEPHQSFPVLIPPLRLNETNSWLLGSIYPTEGGDYLLLQITEKTVSSCQEFPEKVGEFSIDIANIHTKSCHHIITIALQVLSDPQKRAVYDQYGEEGLKGGPPQGSTSGFKTSDDDFQFNPRNAEDIFAEFFGSSPFEFSSMGRAKSVRHQPDSGFFGGFGGPENVFRSYSEGVGPSRGVPRKPPPVESKLPCSLEELYSGSTRKMKISRNVIDANG